MGAHDVFLSVCFFSPEGNGNARLHRVQVRSAIAGMDLQKY